MPRTAEIARTTKETDIRVAINLDGKGVNNIDTGIGFFDHMLTALSKHSGIDMDIVYDHIPLHHTYVKEALETGDKVKGYAQFMGGPIYHLIDAGKKPALDDSLSIGKIILGEQQGRTGDDQLIFFIQCGMPVFDLGLGHDLYHTALEKGIGTKLLLWDSPYQAD